MLTFSWILPALMAAIFGMAASDQSDTELTPFGKILFKDHLTLADEVFAASKLRSYLFANSEKIPTASPDENDWFNAELSSGDMTRLAFALSRPEGCFAAYKNTTSELIEYLDLIAQLSPQKLSLVNDRAPEDKIWIYILTKLSNPIVSDILNCPSKHLANVKEFDPMHKIEAADGDIVLRLVVHLILKKFILEDSRFFHSAENK